MIQAPAPTRSATTRAGDYDLLSRSFRLSLRAENRSPATVETYLQAVTQLGSFLRDRGMSLNVADLSREHVTEYLLDLQARGAKAGTVNVRYRALHRFFAWLEDEGEIGRSPMTKMKPPSVPEEPARMATATSITALIKACRSEKTLLGTRDEAMIRLLADAGLRRSELTGMTLDSIDWDAATITIMGKGSRVRLAAFGPKTGKALDRYARQRERRHGADAGDRFWLNKNGAPLTADGLRQMLEVRSQQAGIPSVNAHSLRHFFAHSYRLNGGDEDSLMSLGGWRSRAMLGRYGAMARGERAVAAHRRFSPGEAL